MTSVYILVQTNTGNELKLQHLIVAGEVLFRVAVWRVRTQPAIEVVQRFIYNARVKVKNIFVY